MTLAEKLKEEGRQEEMVETIEWILDFKFGEEGLQLTPLIRAIQNPARLRTIKDEIKTGENISELQALIESNLTSS